LKPELRPISVTIVDILGSLLPGVVWLVLLITLGELIGIHTNTWPPTHNFTPINVILDLLGEGRGAGVLQNRGVPFYIALTVGALLLGYSVKPVATRYAEMVTAGAEYLLGLRHGGRPFSYYRFPYHEKYADNPMYELIVGRVEEWLDVKAVAPPISLANVRKSRLLATQPFSSCKRILKVLNESLWEETEYREAQVRMIGSLILATLLSIFCALYCMLVNEVSWPTTIWLAASVGAVAVLGYGFRLSRSAEVAYVYLNFLVATSSHVGGGRPGVQTPPQGSAGLDTRRG
jgi:hypothetical protein